MSRTTLRSRGKGSFARGIHPHDWKELAAEAAIEILPTPAEVTIPLVQHIGAPNQPTTKPRQDVAAGDILGDSGAFVCAPVHTPIAGKTALPLRVTLPNGRHVDAVPVKAEGDQMAEQALWDDIFGGSWPTDGQDGLDADTILARIRAGGLVGMGGAGFPTHVKLKPNPAKPVDVLLVNGSECEPYLTADYRLMVEASAPIVAGSLLAAQAAGAVRIVISIEDNKPEAVARMRDAAAGTGIEVVATTTKYPMGGEKQLILATLGREVPTGGLPLDCGVVVVNVGTAAAIARAVLRGKPLTHRIVTVSGRGVHRPCNLLAPVGVSHGALIAAAGGLTDQAVRVISGGPMMGFAISNLDTPITKGTSGITVLTGQDVQAEEETPCVRCGRCVDVCPLHLVPTRLALASRNKDWNLARRYYLTACMECGSCSYVCPARIPLVQLIRAGKATMPRE
ncbi:MAG: electron transport complex subunit RsxC [Planctomycetes bacterium]|nr:electron transport complex subunit RsxC [Planctomycetota bacterium]